MRHSSGVLVVWGSWKGKDPGVVMKGRVGVSGERTTVRAMGVGFSAGEREGEG